MIAVNLEGTYVTICDWEGRVVWMSHQEVMLQPGDQIWKHLAEGQQEHAKTVFSRVATLKEKANAEWRNSRNEHFRCWLWPLHTPDTAVCILSIRIPEELQLLTSREKDVLELLALGMTTKEVATKLELSTSTIHTHLRKVREKLGLPNLESVVGFAARYCSSNLA